MDGGTPNKSPPPPARVTSPVRQLLPPVSPRGAAPAFPPVLPRGAALAFPFPQDIRFGGRSDVRPKGYDQRPPGDGLFNMPPATLTTEQQELLDIQTVLQAQGSQIQVLRRTMQGIGDNVSGVESNVSIMNGAFKKIMADNVNAMRAVHDRVSRVQTGMASLYDQIDSSPKLVRKPYTKPASVRKRFNGKQHLWRTRPGVTLCFTPTCCLRRRICPGGLPYNTGWNTTTSRNFSYRDGYVTLTPQFRLPSLTI